jgi:transcriptional regulator with XRE-family HTH domain
MEAQHTSEKQRQAKKILHPDFAERLTQAADAHPHCPTPNHGRLGWVAEQLESRFGLKVSIEGVRRWFAGESRPSIKKLHSVAELFQVDEAWLGIGKTPDLSVKEKKLRDAEADGAVNLLAGIIQMAGGHPAFPADGDKSTADLFAIIRGAQYAIRVVVAHTVDDGVRFVVPADAKEQLVVGILPHAGHRYDIFEITPEMIEGAPRRGGYVDITVSDPSSEAGLRAIETFSERI